MKKCLQVKKPVSCVDFWQRKVRILSLDDWCGLTFFGTEVFVVGFPDVGSIRFLLNHKRC